MGEDKSTDNISSHPGGQDTSGIEGLKWIDSQSVAELIKGEHPQIIATILVHLDRHQASDILGQLDRAAAQRRAAAHRHAGRYSTVRAA